MPLFEDYYYRVSYTQGLSYHYLKYTVNINNDLRDNRFIQFLYFLFQNTIDNLLIIFGGIPVIFTIPLANYSFYCLSLLERTSFVLNRYERWMVK